MNTPDAPPRSILLATNLSADCDRALDRAVALAGRWGAALHIVHALQSSDAAPAWWTLDGSPADVDANQVALVEHSIRRDLLEPVENLDIHVEVGNPTDVIAQIAAREACGLIIVGASGPSFASLIARTITEQLLRRSGCSLLIVKTRPRGPYRRLVVGTDLTPEARHGLETAAAWFGKPDIQLVHALDIPYRSMFIASGHGDEFARMEQDALARFLDGAALPAKARERIHALLAYGYPETALADYSRAHNVDLTVIGTLTRGPVFHLLARSTAARIVQAVPTDILIVRDARATPSIDPAIRRTAAG